MENKNNYDVIIIGGGAAGFAAACFIAEISQNKVLIIEKNTTPMKKLAITGKGRCNLTNNCDVETVLRNIPNAVGNAKKSAFMRSALSKFTPADVIEFFENRGVSLKTERGGRVFPVSDKSQDIVDALMKAAKSGNTHSGADIVTALMLEDGVVKGEKTKKSTYYAKNVIVATGGMSYPKTGSTGDGYKLAEQAGHTIIAPKAALVGLNTHFDCPREIHPTGLTLKNAVLTLEKAGKTLFREQGEVLFTHTGISGPLVLSASWFVGEDCSNPENAYTVHIDLKPALDEKTLDARILRDFSLYKNKQFKNALCDLLPEKMRAVFLSRLDIDSEKKVCEITKQERRRLLSLLKDFTLQIKSLGAIEEAVITDGGVSLNEINPRTMQSKLVNGLYFAGEVIDIAAYTGGFNLQIAFSTAYCAACDITPHDKSCELIL
jgi:predicted Rossmann fold flavoprotein